MSTAALIGLVAGAWFVGAVPVALAVGRVLRWRDESAARSRRSSVAGRHRRGSVTVQEVPASPELGDTVVDPAQVVGEGGENPAESCRGASMAG